MINATRSTVCHYYNDKRSGDMLAEKQTHTNTDHNTRNRCHRQVKNNSIFYLRKKTSKRSLFSTAYSSTLRREFTAQRSRDIPAEVVCKSVVVVTACVVVATDGVVVCDVVAGKNRDS